MSRRSSSQHHHRNHSRRPQDAVAPRWAGLSLVHAGRQLRIGPIPFWVAVGTPVIMAAWTPPPAPHFSLPPHPPPSAPRTSIPAKGAGGIGGVTARLQASLDRLEQRQAAMVNSIADNYDSKARRMRGVLIELGLDVAKTATRDGAGAMGGPFIPAQLPKDAMSFERQLHRIQVTRAQISRLTRTLGAVPVRKPIDGELDLQSGFGVRIDPFLGRPAMHTGLDLHGETGDVVRATADGTVPAAGWSGGYGRPVGIHHVNGLASRDGHPLACRRPA